MNQSTNTVLPNYLLNFFGAFHLSSYLHRWMLRHTYQN